MWAQCSWHRCWGGLLASSWLLCPWVQLVFSCGFVSTAACVSSTGVAPEAALEGLGLPQGGPAVEGAQRLGSRGPWRPRVCRDAVAQLEPPSSLWPLASQRSFLAAPSLWRCVFKALTRPPWLETFSVAQRVKHLKASFLPGPSRFFSCQHWGERPQGWLHPPRGTLQSKRTSPWG